MIFLYELEISGEVIQRIHQTAKSGGLCEDLLSEIEFEAVLVHFCFYDCCANASEAGQKIATDQKDYHKCFFSVIIC